MDDRRNVDRNSNFRNRLNELFTFETIYQFSFADESTLDEGLLLVGIVDLEYRVNRGSQCRLIV